MQFQICNFGEIWTSVTTAEAHRIVRKRTGALAKIIREVRKGERQEARDYRRAERGLQQELREADRRSRALWKRIRVRPQDRPPTAIERKPQIHRTTRTGWLAAAARLPRYSGQIIDRAGRAGIFFRVRYYGHATKAGVGRRATLYIWQGAHEMDDGRIMFLSNVGETVDEAVAALEAVELFNREAQEGAKVLFHAIANVPYQLLEMERGVERMFEIGRRFAENQFGDRDLPFALALHPPSEEGDQRNWHLHLLFSTRPLVRTGDHEWDIGRMMRREIDNPDAFEAMRHLYAKLQTDVVQEAGLDIRYTALSNAERGLANPPQKHLGSAGTARVRRGERDAVNDRNWEKSLAGEAALLDERFRHAQEAVAAGMALIDRVEKRATPLLVGMTPAPALSIAAALRPASIVGKFPLAVANIGDDTLPVPMTLPIANVQPVARAIMAVPTVKAVSAKPKPPAMPSVAAVRVRQPRRVTVPKTIDREPIGIAPLLSASAVTPKLPLPMISIPSRSAILATDSAFPYERGLSIGIVRSSTHRVIDVPKRALASESDAVDQDIQQIFQLLEGRKAEATTRQDRLHRERLARQRVEAERLRQQQHDERQREDDRQKREAEDAQRLQAEHEVAEVLDAMLKAIEAERILIAFDRDDRCVVDDAVLARFGVAPAAISSVAAQARLNEIADQQRGEIARLGIHLLAHAGDAVHGPGGWTLSATAPADLRRIADAWRHEPALQKALADKAAAHAAQRAKAAALVNVVASAAEPTAMSAPAQSPSQQPSPMMPIRPPRRPFPFDPGQGH